VVSQPSRDPIFAGGVGNIPIAADINHCEHRIRFVALFFDGRNVAGKTSRDPLARNDVLGVVPASEPTHNHRKSGCAKIVDESAEALAKAEQRFANERPRRTGSPRSRG
jgi:hypothetical protein